MIFRIYYGEIFRSSRFYIPGKATHFGSILTQVFDMKMDLANVNGFLYEPISDKPISGLFKIPLYRNFQEARESDCGLFFITKEIYVESEISILNGEFMDVTDSEKARNLHVKMATKIYCDYASDLCRPIY